MDSSESDPLCLVFVPALVAVLLNAEKTKGAPLTECEVLQIRGRSVCMRVRYSVALAQEKNRGYKDIAPERCWDEWQRIRSQLRDRDA